MTSQATESPLLGGVGEMTAHDLERVREFVDAAPSRDLAATYAENMKRREVDLGFNPFALVSDIYYRENFHSDLLAAILDPQSKHNQGNVFLRLFLEFLRDRHGIPIDPSNYDRARVEKESARIDLLIWDEHSSKAIIIENKINGAGDMDRQVVRYLEAVVDNRGLECEAIVYLPLLQKKMPERSGWARQEIERVDPLLCIICAYRESGLNDDLYHGWLKACEEYGDLDETRQVIRHYRQLILKLGRNAMNLPTMEKFYELVKDAERYRAAIHLHNVMGDLPAFRCQRLFETLQSKALPFKKTYLYRPTIAVFENCGLENVKIHVETTDLQTTVLSFWNNIEGDQIHLVPQKILAELGLIDQFVCQDGWFNREFSYPGDEQALYEFLAMFLKRLKDYLDQTS